MPVTKNAMVRYKVLDKCFRDRFTRYSIDKLMECCEEELSYPVSRRQIYADIEHMESDAGWQIRLKRERDYHTVYYRYGDPEFSIFKQPLTADEVEQLRESILMLNRLKGLPNTEWLDEFTSRLENEFGDFSRTENVMSFQNNEFLKGLEHLTPLFEAIIHKKVLNIKYKPFSKNTINYCLHPYYLKQYNNRWFLFGRCEGLQYMPNLPLDRIESIDVNENEEYIPNTTIDFNEYFDDVIGVSILNAPVEKVLLKFDEKGFPYACSKPLHGSQKIKDREQGIIELTVIPNKELELLIFSFGNQVEVLAPESLRSKFAEMTKSMAEKYQ